MRGANTRVATRHTGSAANTRTCVSRTRESRNIGSVMTGKVRNGGRKVVPDCVDARNLLLLARQAEELELCAAVCIV